MDVIAVHKSEAKPKEFVKSEKPKFTPKPATDAKKIWCSKDRAGTWAAWMQKDTPLPADMSCDTTGLDKIMKIGTDVVQVDGTPTIILEKQPEVPNPLLNK